MRRTWYIVWGSAIALACGSGCGPNLPPQGGTTGADTTKSQPLVCSSDDTLSRKEAAEMITDWDSVTEDLPINNRVAILAAYLQPLLEEAKDYPTLRIYLGLVPTDMEDSLNIGLIAMQVDTNCNDRDGQNSYLLFTGTLGDSTQISDSLANAYMHSFVTTIYGLPEFEGWPEVRGLGFSVAYITSILTYGEPDQKVEANFAVRDYSCDEVGETCPAGKTRVKGIDVILQEYQLELPRNIDVKRVAINFSVPCPRFCGVTSDVSPRP